MVIQLLPSIGWKACSSSISWSSILSKISSLFPCGSISPWCYVTILSHALQFDCEPENQVMTTPTCSARRYYPSQLQVRKLSASWWDASLTASLMWLAAQPTLKTSLFSCLTWCSEGPSESDLRVTLRSVFSVRVPQFPHLLTECNEATCFLDCGEGYMSIRSERTELLAFDSVWWIQMVILHRSS